MQQDSTYQCLHKWGTEDWYVVTGIHTQTHTHTCTHIHTHPNNVQIFFQQAGNIKPSNETVGHDC